MLVTSAEANKYLKKLLREHSELLEDEKKRSSFIAAIEEDIEEVRPGYDFQAVQDRLEEIESQIRDVKHSISIFNCHTTIPGYDITIDQMLVRIPQISARIAKLGKMSGRLGKMRINSIPGAGNHIEYQHANYDVAQAKAAYDDACNELAKCHLALDKVNNDIKFEVDCMSEEDAVS